MVTRLKLQINPAPPDLLSEYNRTLVLTLVSGQLYLRLYFFCLPRLCPFTGAPTVFQNSNTVASTQVILVVGAIFSIVCLETFYFFSEDFTSAERETTFAFAVMSRGLYFRSGARRSFEKIERLWTDYFGTDTTSLWPVHLKVTIFSDYLL